MNKFALVAENGEVVSVVHPSHDSMFSEGQQVGTETAHSFEYEESDTTVINEWYWRYAWVKNKPARPGNYYYWDNYEWNLNTEALVTEMRSLRDYKLGRSDWTQVADSPLSDTDKAAWATYRKALRDVPANNPNITDLDEVSWPTEPGG
jgi:hypothetical protein